MKSLLEYIYRIDDDILDMELFIKNTGIFTIQEVWNKGWNEIVDENLKTHNKSLLQKTASQEVS